MISFLIFLVYAPISCYVKNVANKKINNKTEIWSIKNNSIMLRLLRKNDRRMYCMMIFEHIIFIQFLIVSVLKIVI